MAKKLRLKKGVDPKTLMAGRGRWWVKSPGESLMPGTDELYEELGRLHKIYEGKKRRLLLERGLAEKPGRMVAAILGIEVPEKGMRSQKPFSLLTDTLTQLGEIAVMLDMKPARTLEHLIAYLHMRLKRAEKKLTH